MRCKRPMVTPPDASVGTRPATCFTAAASSRSPRLSSRSRSAPAASASSICSGVLTSASTRRNGEAAALARRTASPIPPAAAAWLSLTRMPSNSAPRWFSPPRAHPGARLARVEQPRPGAAQRLRVLAGERGHPAQPLQEVQRGALGAEQGAQPPANAEDPGAGVGGVALPEQGLQLALPVERAEEARGGGHAGDDQRLLRDHQGGAARLRRNAGLGGAV